MKRIGIVGGLGPQATANFYTRLALEGSALLGVRPAMIMSSVQIQMAEEMGYLENTDSRIPPCYEVVIGDAIDDLCRIGVSAVVMPCFSLTDVLNRMAMARELQPISAFDRAGRSLSDLPGPRIGVLGTSHVQDMLRSLLSGTLTVVKPCAGFQRRILDMICTILTGGNPVDLASSFEEVCEALQHQVDGYLIACSELSLIPRPSGFEFVDLLDELLRETMYFWGSPD